MAIHCKVVSAVLVWFGLLFAELHKGLPKRQAIRTLAHPQPPVPLSSISWVLSWDFNVKKKKDVSRVSSSPWSSGPPTGTGELASAGRFSENLEGPGRTRNVHFYQAPRRGSGKMSQGAQVGVGPCEKSMGTFFSSSPACDGNDRTCPL